MNTSFTEAEYKRGEAAVRKYMEKKYPGSVYTIKAWQNTESIVATDSAELWLQFNMADLVNGHVVEAN